jgi:Uma2 family endonuclease
LTADDWLNLMLLAIFAPLAPFLVIEIISPSVGFKLFGALSRAPWRQM